MKKLYYVRHGESYINIEDVFSSKPGTPLDKGLTPTGERQVREGAERAQAADLQFDHIICSTSTRARESATIIAETFEYPLDAIEYTDEVIELQFGSLEGSSWNAYWQSGKSYKDLANYDQAETVEQLQQRAEKALQRIKNMPYTSILVVSHSAFGRAFRRAINGESYEREFTMERKDKSLPHGEILELI